MIFKINVFQILDSKQLVLKNGFCTNKDASIFFQYFLKCSQKQI